MVTLFAMFRKIQARNLDFRRNTQPKDGLDYIGNNGRPTNGHAESNPNGLELFNPETAVRNKFSQPILRGSIGGVHLVAHVRKVVDEVRISLGTGEEAGQERPQRPPHCMDAEGIQRIVVARSEERRVGKEIRSAWSR